MKALIIIGILLVIIAVTAFVVGIIMITGAADELYRDLDDLDQARYIREWQVKQNAKKAKRQKR
jgi:flagellar basal body-associated protein FliL